MILHREASFHRTPAGIQRTEACINKALSGLYNWRFTDHARPPYLFALPIGVDDDPVARLQPNGGLSFIRYFNRIRKKIAVLFRT